MLRSRVLGVGFAAFLALGGMAQAAQNQQIILSFDGAHNNDVWQRSFDLAEKTGAKFTYFVSCVYLLDRDKKGLYQAPDGRRGRSNVGFGSGRDDIAARLDNIWRAHMEGHDIASHGCGHFDGGKWSKAEWRHEFDQFSSILANAWSTNEIEGEPEGWKDFAQRDIRGFRAPYLSTGPGLYQALVDSGYRYDASAVSRGPAKPESAFGLTRFSLPLIPEGPRNKLIIAMDYNLFARHSRAKETEDVDGRFEERTYQAFKAAFEKQYDGDRIPLQIGYHFTLMNGGAYWRALERFAGEVCVRTDVDCVSYAMALDGPTASVTPYKDATLRGAVE